MNQNFCLLTKLAKGFQDLLMQDGSYVGDLSLGQLTEFVDTQLTKEEATA